MIKNMNILQKAYIALKQTIKFELFKRKFNNWCDKREIDLLKYIGESEQEIINNLSSDRLDWAFCRYIQMNNSEKELKQLSDFKNFILNKSNETDDN
jgi:hypothetical protein